MKPAPVHTEAGIFGLEGLARARLGSEETTLLPDSRVAVGVEDGNDFDGPFLPAVIDGVREPPQQAPAHGRGHSGTGIGIAGNVVESGVQREPKIEG
jgi:hypothetical protein